MTTIPALMGVAEIGRALSVSKQRANTITGQDGLDFPAPVVDYLACGRLWLKADVDAWVAGPHGREWRERRGRYGRAEARRPGGTGRHTAHTPDGTT